MQVILIEPVRNLGKVGDVVKVRGGFARNYLLPQKKALRSTKDNIAYFESRKAEIEKENASKHAESEKIAKALEGSFVALIRQAGEDGRLYGSATALDIAREISERGKGEIDRKQVYLSKPIKYIGVYDVELHLHGELTAKINVNIARSDTEAKDAEKRVKRGEKVMEGPDGEEALKQAAAEAEEKATKTEKKTEKKEKTEAKTEEEAPAAEEKEEKKAKKKAEKKEEVSEEKETKPKTKAKKATKKDE